jgi:hypothetical protein
MLYHLISHLITALNPPDFASAFRHIMPAILVQLTDQR